ncbi:MAG: tRNA pseudouridine(13) synthase TruD, partial [Caldilineaceae bacterium]|nr:tRNA pseudouridine(13) synthase TruD [Caldilineaceae bacterium]
MCTDIPIIGGEYKTEPEDFRVDELPHTRWSGAGDYLYLRIEKRRMGTPTLTQYIHNHLEVPFPS